VNHIDAAELAVTNKRATRMPDQRATSKAGVVAGGLGLLIAVALVAYGFSFWSPALAYIVAGLGLAGTSAGVMIAMNSGVDATHGCAIRAGSAEPLRP
jgi:hypothetical protein